jgi:hypothetical protein
VAEIAIRPGRHLLPLDRCRWFAGNIVSNTRYAIDFVNDAQ